MSSGSLWRSARPLVVGRAVSALVGIALPAVLARTLDRSAYGTYKQVYLVANLAMYSLQLGLAQSLFYFVPRAASEEERRGYIAQTQVALAALGLATFLGLLAFAPFIARRFSDPQFADLALPIALLTGALLASSPLEISLTSRGKPQWSAFALIASDLTRVALMLGAVLTGHGLAGLVWGAALAASARWVASLALSGGSLRARPRWRTVKVQLAYAVPFGLAVLLRQQQLQLHQVFVAARATPSLFALYAVGCMQIPIVSLLYAPVSETLQVRLAGLERSRDAGESARLFGEAVEKLALIFLPLAALLIATARPGIELLFGAKYLAAAPVMRIAVLGVAVQSLPVDSVLKARARTPTLLWTYAVKLAVTWPAIASGWALAGMAGVIAAHVALEAVTKVGQLAIVALDLNVKITRLFGGRAMLRTLGAAIAGGGLGLVVTSTLHAPFVACLVATPLTLCFSGLDYLLRRRHSHRRHAPVLAKASKSEAA